jgi:dolichyl-phosphate-mannose--protein O-mannosyl transferase
MTPAPHHPRDPLAWCVGLTLAFLALMLVRLGMPSKLYFDEIHYVPAARDLMHLTAWKNKEHPMFGKEMLVVGMALFGDNAWGWRLLPALAGAGTLFASMRALWLASCSRFATVAYGVLLATGMMLFVQSRVAMLDIFMLATLALAYWQLAGAVREPETGRWRLAIAGVALGLAMGSKWNAVLPAVVPGLAVLAVRLRAYGWRGLWTHRGAPVPGITLIEAALWLGLVPLFVYWLTFTPALLFPHKGMQIGHFIELQQEMVRLQQSVVKPHPYMTRWWQWVLDLRGIWYLYEPIAGAQRGILMLGNPFTFIAALPAVLWCAWAGWKGRSDALAVAILYLVTIGFWVFARKPVQFFYHYLTPSMFLLAALALALGEWWKRGHRWLPLLVLALSCAVFAWFYPILSAAPLHGGKKAFEYWMLLDTWR